MVQDSIIVPCGRCGAKNRIPRSRIGDRPVCGRCKTPLQPASAYPDRAIDADERTFPSEVLSFPGPVLVFFWAPWCGHCRRMMPLIEDLAAQYTGRIKFVKVDMDRSPGLAARYQVQSVPNLVFIKNGQVVNRLLGALPKDQIIYYLNSIL